MDSITAQYPTVFPANKHDNGAKWSSHECVLQSCSLKQNKAEWKNVHYGPNKVIITTLLIHYPGISPAPKQHTVLYCSLFIPLLNCSIYI